MTLCCLSCWRRDGVLVPATNHGDIYRCEACAEAVWLQQQAVSQ